MLFGALLLEMIGPSGPPRLSIEVRYLIWASALGRDAGSLRVDDIAPSRERLFREACVIRCDKSITGDLRRPFGDFLVPWDGFSFPASLGLFLREVSMRFGAFGLSAKTWIVASVTFHGRTGQVRSFGALRGRTGSRRPSLRRFRRGAFGGLRASPRWPGTFGFR